MRVVGDVERQLHLEHRPAPLASPSVDPAAHRLHDPPADEEADARALLEAADAALKAADIKILSPGATEGVLNELLPQFERSSGHRVTINYGPAGNIAARVRKGDFTIQLSRQ